MHDRGGSTDYFARDRSSSGLRSRAVKGGGASIIAELISLVIHMAGVVVLGRLLKPGDFGTVAMVTAFYLLLANFGFNGFTEFIIQKKDLDHAQLSSLFWLHGTIALVLTLSFAAVAPLLSRFYAETAIERVVRVMSVGILFRMLSTHHLALLQRGMRFGRVAVNTVVARLLSVTLAIAMACVGCEYWSIVGRQVGEAVFVAVGAWLMCSWRPGPPAASRGVLEGIRFALHVYGNFTLDYFARNVDKALLGHYHGSTTLGNYDRAYYLASMPGQQLVTPLHSVALATLSRLRNEPDKYISYYRTALSTLCVVGFAASVVLTTSGHDIVTILLGPGWEQAGAVARAFGPGAGAMIVYSTFSWFHLSLARPDRWLRWSLFAAALTAAFIAVAAPFGAVAVATTYSLSYYVLMLPAIWYAARPIGLRIGLLVKTISPSFTAGAVSTLFWLAAKEIWPATSGSFVGLSVPVRLAVLVPGSVLLYGILVVCFHRSTRPITDLFSLVRVFLLRDSLSNPV